MPKKGRQCGKGDEMEKKVLLQRLEDADVDVSDAVKRFMGNEELYLKFIRKLPESLKLDKLEASLQSEKERDFYHYMHDLKGLAGNLGLLQIYDPANAALVEYRSSGLRNLKKMYGWLSEIRDYSQKVMAILEEDSDNDETGSEL